MKGKWREQSGCFLGNTKQRLLIAVSGWLFCFVRTVPNDPGLTQNSSAELLDLTVLQNGVF